MNQKEFEITLPNGCTATITIDTDTNTTSSVLQHGPGNKYVDLDPQTLKPYPGH